MNVQSFNASLAAINIELIINSIVTIVAAFIGAWFGAKFAAERNARSQPELLRKLNETHNSLSAIARRLPGGQTCASASNEQNITITAKAEEVYFIEARTNWGAGFNTAACEIRLISTGEGMRMLAEVERRR